MSFQSNNFAGCVFTSAVTSALVSSAGIAYGNRKRKFDSQKNGSTSIAMPSVSSLARLRDYYRRENIPQMPQFINNSTEDAWKTVDLKFGRYLQYLTNCLEMHLQNTNNTLFGAAIRGVDDILTHLESFSTYSNNEFLFGIPFVSDWYHFSISLTYLCMLVLLDEGAPPALQARSSVAISKIIETPLRSLGWDRTGAYGLYMGLPWLANQLFLADPTTKNIIVQSNMIWIITATNEPFQEMMRENQVTYHDTNAIQNGYYIDDTVIVYNSVNYYGKQLTLRPYVVALCILLNNFTFRNRLRNIFTKIIHPTIDSLGFGMLNQTTTQEFTRSSVHWVPTKFEMKTIPIPGWIIVKAPEYVFYARAQRLGVTAYLSYNDVAWMSQVWIQARKILFDTLNVSPEMAILLPGVITNGVGPLHVRRHVSSTVNIQSNYIDDTLNRNTFAIQCDRFVAIQNSYIIVNDFPPFSIFEITVATMTGQVATIMQCTYIPGSNLADETTNWILNCADPVDGDRIDLTVIVNGTPSSDTQISLSKTSMTQVLFIQKVKSVVSKFDIVSMDIQNDNLTNVVLKEGSQLHNYQILSTPNLAMVCTESRRWASNRSAILDDKITINDIQISRNRNTLMYEW